MDKIYGFDGLGGDMDDKEKRKLEKAQLDNSTISVIENILDGTPGLLITEVPTGNGVMSGMYKFNMPNEHSYLKLFSELALPIMYFITHCHDSKDIAAFTSLIAKYAPKEDPEIIE